MKYMLLICRDEPTWAKLSGTERQQVYRDTLKLAEELTERGQYLAGYPLHPSSVATSIRIRDGKRLVTDGPFAETREQLGGFMLIDVKDLDEAIAIAARVPLARTSTVEVRPVTVALNSGENSGISAGLSRGERVVVDGQTHLKQGSKVRYDLATLADLRLALESHPKGS